MMPSNRPVRCLLLATLLTICATGAASATVIFSDSFDYTAGALAGKGPPAGSTTGQGAWTNFTGAAQVTAGGLTYPGVSSGSNKATISGLNASLGDNAGASTSQFGGAGGGVVWVGFLINQASGAANPGGYAVVFVGPSDNSNPGIGIGILDNQNVYGIDNNLIDPVERAQSSVSVGEDVVFLAVKLDFSAGMEYLFVDPPLDTEPPISSASASQAMTPAFQAAGCGQTALAAGANNASFNIGELRLGTAFTEVIPGAASHPAFFTEETALGNGVYYLAFPDGNPFGYYSYLSDFHYIYHFDLGYEYVFDADDGKDGVYLYDFASSDFFYTSPSFPFPYLYDFGLNTVLYYYPDPNDPGRYNTDGVRYFYEFATGQIITK